MSEELHLVKVEVGKPFPLFNRSECDGAYFEASEFGQGYYLCVNFLNMHPSEIDIISHETVRMRIVENIDGMVLMMIRFGNTHMIFEMSFDPTLYDDTRALQFTSENNFITIFGIERNGNILKSIRHANLPLKMIQWCRESWTKAFSEPNYSERYSKWYIELQRKYSMEGLWARGVDVGKLGETYNLDEINYKYKK